MKFKTSAYEISREELTLIFLWTDLLKYMNLVTAFKNVWILLERFIIISGSVDWLRTLGGIFCKHARET